MGTLAAAFAIMFAAVVSYVTWLARQHHRLRLRLDALEAATKPEDMNVPGFDFHPLKGFRPIRYTVHVNGPWCITFEFEKGDACRVDFEQYH